ncbi:PIN domain-containing protein [Acidobacteria bacterium AH-259-O06]|nr:PIN domain-containing protein [Acidobacteria bacterium AH-259-O06]
MTEYNVSVHIAQFNADELTEYLPQMARKYDLPVELVEMQWRVLPVKIHAQGLYESFLCEAGEDMAERDPEDAHVLALARSLNLPIWTNDRDLTGKSITCYPTARLLRILEEQSGA